MNLSNPDSALWPSGCAPECSEELAEDGAQVVAPREAELVSGKYKAWLAKAFEDVPSLTPKRRLPVFLWAKACDRADVVIWEELGLTSLEFLECLSIGVAGRVSADLYRKGVGRAAG